MFSISLNISWSVAVNWGMVGGVRVMCMHVRVVCECVCIMYAVYACLSTVSVYWWTGLDRCGMSFLIEMYSVCINCQRYM